MAERDDIIVIDPKDYPGNSNKSKEVKKKAEKVVDGAVKRSKPSFFRQAANAIFSDVNEDDLRSEIIFDYLVPTIKDTIVEMGKMLLDAIFYGSATTHKKSSGNKPYRVSYSNYYDKDDRSPSSIKASSYNFDEIAMNSRGDAEQVLDNLIDMTREYGSASVGDFCDLVGVDNNFTDYKYGWTNLSKTTITRTRDGYIIDFPKPVKLD